MLKKLALALSFAALASQSFGQIFADKNAWEADLVKYNNLIAFNANWYSKDDWKNNIFPLEETKQLFRSGNLAYTYKVGAEIKSMIINVNVSVDDTLKLTDNGTVVAYGIGHGDNFGIENGWLYDRVSSLGTTSIYLDPTEQLQISAWGTYFDLTPGGAGKGLSTNSGDIASNTKGGFFGGSGSVIEISPGKELGMAESYRMSSEIYYGKVTYEVSAAPEPETYAMLLLGLGSIGYVKRKKLLTTRMEQKH